MTLAVEDVIKALERLAILNEQAGSPSAPVLRQAVEMLEHQRSDIFAFGDRLEALKENLAELAVEVPELTNRYGFLLDNANQAVEILAGVMEEFSGPDWPSLQVNDALVVLRRGINFDEPEESVQGNGTVA